MSDRSPDSLVVLNRRSQQLLIDFLLADLDLAFTFVQTGVIETGSDEAHAEAAFDKAATALETIKRFLPRVEEPVERERITDRAAELERLLADSRA